ncbi:hypothetical protein G7072_16520 [Nocardioides sp. HDW12B]|uniref:DUF2231 domain-containing protein n=1 Tax=Nocardioides sp. HDW12B TaxID=2714939 RepID=UPI001409E701|nr:DUF2231 domain-containing protein [Nocardioides sp. HDW12B]QIK67735.1 hypothetical protein G7072_16520 [Nocardioides sp. HDW12B]
MPETVFGLPVHPLVVHATVVLVPLTALVLLLAVLLPRFRTWAGWLPLGLAVVSTVLVPISTSSGENFEEQLGGSKLIEEHAELGEMLIWWCLGMLAVAVALTVVGRRSARSSRAPSKGTALALAVAGVVACVGTLVQVVLIGHSGAEAAWGGLASSSSADTDG